MSESGGGGPAGWLEGREKGNTRTHCPHARDPLTLAPASLLVSTCISPSDLPGRVASVWLSLLPSLGVSGVPVLQLRTWDARAGRGQGRLGQVVPRASVSQLVCPTPLFSLRFLLRRGPRVLLYLMGDTAKSRQTYFFFF